MAVIVTVVRDDGSREAPSISDSLIINTYMAKLRGDSYLDNPNQGGYYSAKARSLKVPHKNSLVVPGKWITVSDSHLGLDGKKLKVLSYKITLTPVSVWATTETESYEAVSR